MYKVYQMFEINKMGEYIYLGEVLNEWLLKDEVEWYKENGHNIRVRVFEVENAPRFMEV